MKRVSNRALGRVPMRGFSLVEVLVSMSLSLFVLLTMLAVTEMSARGYQGATRRIDTMVEARGALRILADDVSTMLGQGDSLFGFDDSREHFHELWFLTLKPVDAQDENKAVGDVCFVHYFTAVTPDSPVVDSVSTRKLYRRFLASEDVLPSLRLGKLPENERAPEEAEIVAFNVMGFRVFPQALGTEAAVYERLGVELFVLDNETSVRFRTAADWSYETLLAKELLLELGEQESKLGARFRIEMRLRNEA